MLQILYNSLEARVDIKIDIEKYIGWQMNAWIIYLDDNMFENYFGFLTYFDTYYIKMYQIQIDLSVCINSYYLVEAKADKQIEIIEFRQAENVLEHSLYLDKPGEVFLVTQG